MTLNELKEFLAKAAADQQKWAKSVAELAKLDRDRSKNLEAILLKMATLQKKLDTADEQTATAIRSWMPAYEKALNETIQELKRSFGSDLASRLSGISLELGGQYPKLRAGLFTFEVAFESGRCKLWYGPQQESLHTVAADVDKITKLVKQEQESLGSLAAPDEFLTLMRDAYRHASLDSTGPAVAIPALLPYIALGMQRSSFRMNPTKEQFQTYRRADLSYDLYRLNTHVRDRFRLNTATRQQTQRRSDFLWIPNDENGNGGYYATIEQR